MPNLNKQKNKQTNKNKIKNKSTTTTLFGQKSNFWAKTAKCSKLTNLLLECGVFAMGTEHPSIPGVSKRSEQSEKWL